MLSIVLNKLGNVFLAYRIYNKLYLCYKICRWNVVDCSKQKLKNVSLAYRIYNKLYLCYKICRWNVVDCSEQTQECFSSLSYLQ